MWGGESGARLRLVCRRGGRGMGFMCGDGGVGWFSVAGGFGGLFQMNGRGTDKKQKRSHETEMTHSR